MNSMKFNFAAFLFLGALAPVASFAQDVIQKDTTVNSKVEKNRNVMLNASATDQPRQINVGLPGTRSATIFEDGVPVSYFFWPDMPFPDFIIFHSLKIMAIDFQAITKKQRLFWVNRPLFFVPLRYVYT